MNLYLVQHAKAASDAEDPRRSLSEKGREELDRIASFVVSRDLLTVSRILHSGKLRAQQTAQVLAERLHLSGGATDVDALKPMDDPAVWVDRLRHESDDLMLVGHLPHLSRLASLLLTGDAAREVISFRNAGIVALVRGDDGTWTISWIITPQIV